jgi:hypothetical protein
MLSDSEKRDLASVFATVLEAKMQEMYTQIAAGFVESMNCMMEDFATIMQAQNKLSVEENRKFLETMRTGSSDRTNKWLDSVLAGR